MKIPHRPSRRLLAGAALLTVTAASVVVGVQHSTTTDTAAPAVAAAAPSPVAQEAAGIPYTAQVSLDLTCGPFPTARVTVDPQPGGHPDVHLEVVRSPYTGAPQHLFNSVTKLDLTMPAHRVTVTVPIEQSSTVSVEAADRVAPADLKLPRQQDFSCPQWGNQGVPNHA